MARVEIQWHHDTGAIREVHIRGAATPFYADALLHGDKYDLTSLPGQLYAALERLGNTGNFHTWTAHALNDPTGTISGTIPHTGISWTGASLLYLYASGSPRTFLGDAQLIDVRGASSDLVP